MIDPNIPEEEMNFDFGIEEITKTVQEASVEPNEEITTNDNFLEDVRETVSNSTVNEENVEDTSTTNTDDSTTDDSTYDSTVYETALEFMKENGLLSIPDNLEDVDEEAWNNIIEQNREYQRQSILNEMRMSADPRVTELFDYVYQGGTWDGFEQMRDTIQSEFNVEELDIANEDDQRYLIESFLSDGLDPQNPAHVRRLKNVSNEVSNVFDRLEQEEVAKEAKDYFLNKLATQKEHLRVEQEAYRQQQLQQQQYQAQQEQQWVNDFQQSLNERQWAQSKKDAVISQFDIVDLEDGSQVEMWKYKFDAMWENPQTVQVFLDFMSDLDPYTLQFNRNGVPPTKQVTSTIQNLINSKNQNKHKGQSSGRRSKSTNTPVTIDPRNL